MTNTSKTMPTYGQTNQPIVFFGTEDFSLASLRALVEAGYKIDTVVTKPDSRKGRGQKVVQPSVKLYAHEQNINVLQPIDLNDIKSQIQAINSPVGVLVSYGKIIPQSIIDLFSPGIINVHPSLLPKYRGPSPIESAIKNGDDSTGVSIMQLSAAMDAGPVYTSVKVNLLGTETRPELYAKLAQLGAELLIESLTQIIAGSLQPTLQNESEATYCKLLSKSDSHLDTNKLTANETERIVRAHLGFPKTKVSVLGHEIIVTKAHVASSQLSPLDIKFHDGSVLRIEQLVAPSGKTMDSDSFLRGYSVG